MVDDPKLQEWIGKTQQAGDEASLPTALRLAALLDLPPKAYRRGDSLPSGWYVTLFTPIERQSQLGPDGHPDKGAFLPPIPLPRRMFAGRRVEFHDALRIGDEVTRLSRITTIIPKEGRSGAMCFVTVRHEISSPRGLAVVEEQDIVYRGESKSGTAKAEVARAPAEAMEWTRTLMPDPVLLFRYSAVTFNAHRIHYDTAYAQNTEGYPERVVNGGLTTLLLWEFAKACISAEIKSSSSRNIAPLFVNRPITLCGRKMEDGKLRMLALNDKGQPAVEAELEMAAS
jgi:3-methylfumaryl-CoA hydratase